MKTVVYLCNAHLALPGHTAHLHARTWSWVKPQSLKTTIWHHTNAQVVLLLISALGLENMLGMIASGEPHPQRSQPALGSPEAMADVDRELRGWWEGTPPSSLTPMLLAWAAHVALANMLEPGVGGASCAPASG